MAATVVAALPEQVTLTHSPAMAVLMVLTLVAQVCGMVAVVEPVQVAMELQEQILVAKVVMVEPVVLA